MLSSLLGSKSIERILLFVLVNENCYTSEIQRAFAIPLTPLQSAMQKLEKAGILQFEKIGKKKLCCFNPEYLLLSELKALLKAAFVHLPAEEKKALFFQKEGWNLSAKDPFKREKRVASCLNAFWKLLESVTSVSIQTQSAGCAFGSVLVKKETETELLFIEKGQWEHQTDFSKTLRWSIDYASGLIRLEHLHYGSTRPVFLFYLAPTGPKTLQSIDSHLCVQDCYFGRIEFTEKHIRFLWRILGPKKNDTLYHIYKMT